jgi:hypothetical protein
LRIRALKILNCNGRKKYGEDREENPDSAQPHSARPKAREWNSVTSSKMRQEIRETMVAGMGVVYKAEDSQVNWNGFVRFLDRDEVGTRGRPRRVSLESNDIFMLFIAQWNFFIFNLYLSETRIRSRRV